jgi:hypothetical protein
LHVPVLHDDQVVGWVELAVSHVVAMVSLVAVIPGYAMPLTYAWI